VFCNNANDCWAVGYDISTTTHVFETLVEHYDGNSWTVVTSPQIALSNELTGLTCASASDCWAVGNQDNGTVYQTLVEHYDGNEWTIFASDNTSANESNVLNNVTCVNANECWAVGFYNRGGSSQTLVEHYTVPVPLTSVVSRKAHDNAGTFDIDLPLDGSGIECRVPGHLPGGASGDYELIFTFTDNLTSVGGVSATATAPGGGTQAVDASGQSGPNTQQYIVNLTGVPNAQYVTVTLNSVLDSAGGSGDVVGPRMGVLLGDVNASGRTDAGDVTAVRNQTVSIPDQQTFRFDVNASGRIDAGDVTVTRNATVTVLP
jgi:hypothetical protein